MGVPGDIRRRLGVLGTDRENLRYRKCCISRASRRDLPENGGGNTRYHSNHSSPKMLRLGFTWTGVTPGNPMTNGQLSAGIVGCGCHSLFVSSDLCTGQSLVREASSIVVRDVHDTGTGGFNLTGRQDYDVCNDQALPNLQTAINQARTNGYRALHLR